MVTLSLFITILSFVILSEGKITLLDFDNPEKIENSYIVIYHQNTTQQQAETHRNWVVFTENNPLSFVYDFGFFKGFASRLSKSTLMSILEDPLVKEVHCDSLVRVAANSCGMTQTNVPSWGLARVSQKGGVASGLRNEYFYNKDASGAGVTAYVIDTGIYINHNDFGGRASYGVNVVDLTDTDENGHGTHSAGTIGGATFGIAKNVKPVSVKVLGKSGSGSISGVIAGIQWVTEQHKSGGGPSVASMSLGSNSDGGLCTAIAASIEAGVVYCTAGGGSNSDSCRFYPAGCPGVISVGATDINRQSNPPVDQRAAYSNQGKCVTLYAPGTTITSCGISSPTSYVTYSGTSMSCSHVAGVVADILSLNPSSTPDQVVGILLNNAQDGLIANLSPDSANKLVYNKCDES